MKHKKGALLVVKAVVRLAQSHEVLTVFVLDLIAQKLRLITSFILFPGADS